MDPHTSGVILGLIAMCGFGLANALSKKVSQEVGTHSSVFFRQLGITVCLVLSTFFLPHKPFVFDPKMYVMCFGVAILGYASLFSYYQGIKVGNVGVVSAIANTNAVITITLGVLFLGEALSVSRIIGVAFVLGGIAALSIKKKHRGQTGVGYALITMVGWGIVFFLYVFPIRTLGSLHAVLLIDFMLLIFITIHTLVDHGRILIPKKSFWYAAGIGVLTAIALIAYSIGFEVSTVGLIVALAGANPLIMTLFAHYKYQEKLTHKQWGAIIVIIIGIAFISF